MATCSTRSSCRVLPDHRVAAAIEHGQDNDSSFIRSEVDTWLNHEIDDLESFASNDAPLHTEWPGTAARCRP